MPNLLTRLSEWTNARRKLVWLLLFVLVVAVVAIVLTPVFLIMLFKAQTPRTMEISYWLRRWSPFVTLLGSLAILIFTIGLWFGGRWWSRAFMLLLLVPTFSATWLARQNHFEWMFNPLANPAYAKAADASFVTY
jgi:energy-coupling factor transporter transmembrane protein EcfT